MCRSKSHIFSDGAPYAMFQKVVSIITPQLNTPVPEGQEPCPHSPAEFPSHAHTTNPGPQSPDSSSSCSHPPTLSSPGTWHLPPPRQRGCCTHCIWGSGKPSWSRPCTRGQSGAAQLREQDDRKATALAQTHVKGNLPGHRPQATISCLGILVRTSTNPGISE